MVYSRIALMRSKRQLISMLKTGHLDRIMPLRMMSLIRKREQPRYRIFPLMISNKLILKAIFDRNLLAVFQKKLKDEIYKDMKR